MPLQFGFVFVKLFAQIRRNWLTSHCASNELIWMCGGKLWGFNGVHFLFWYFVYQHDVSVDKDWILHFKIYTQFSCCGFVQAGNKVWLQNRIFSGCRLLTAGMLWTWNYTYLLRSTFDIFSFPDQSTVGNAVPCSSSMLPARQISYQKRFDSQLKEVCLTERPDLVKAHLGVSLMLRSGQISACSDCATLIWSRNIFAPCVCPMSPQLAVSSTVETRKIVYFDFWNHPERAIPHQNCLCWQRWWNLRP